MDVLSALDRPEWQALRLSLLVALIAVAIALPLALGGAFIVSRSRLPGRSANNAALHLPLMLPPIVVGYLLLVLLGVKGPIGQPLFDAFGLRIAFTIKAVVIATAVMILPVMTRSIRLGLDMMDRGLQAAARTLGASRMDAFASITLPLLGPGILAAAALGITAALGEFGAVIIFAANIEGETRTLPLAIYTALQAPGREASAARRPAVDARDRVFGQDRLAIVELEVRSQAERPGKPVRRDLLGFNHLALQRQSLVDAV
jgi:molybdate transport system permease protein